MYPIDTDPEAQVFPAELTPAHATRHDPLAAMRQRDFRLFFIGRFVSTMGEQMVGVAIGWDLYLRTHNPLALGFVGLAQVIPVIGLALPAGFVADRVTRKLVMMAAQTLLALCVLGLALLSATRGSLVLIYLCIFGTGVAQIFNDAASSSMVPQTVAPELFENAATWNSSAWQLASVIGPTLGGVVIALEAGKAALVYALDVGAVVVYLIVLALIRGRPVALSREAPSLRGLHPSHAGHPGGDHAGSLRGAAGRGHHVAADLRDRHLARGRGGAGLAARRAERGGRVHGADAGVSPPLSPCRAHAAFGRGGLWRGDHHLWPLAQYLVVAGYAGDPGRDG
jgi:MFS family permease